MLNKRQFVARADPKHGVVHRDVSAQYDMEMTKRYGRKWKQVLRKLNEQKKLNLEDL